MSLRSLCTVIKSTQSMLLSRRSICSRWIGIAQRRLFTSDSSCSKPPFRSLLFDTNVTSPFEDPSRIRKKRPLATSTIRNAKLVDELETPNKKIPLSELEDMKRMADRLINENIKQIDASSHVKQDAQETKESSEVDTNENTVALGGSTTTTLSAYRRFWKKFHQTMGTEVDENASYEERRRQKMARNTKLGTIFLLASSCVGFVWFCFYYGRAKRDSEGNVIKDDFSGSFFAPFYRIVNSLKLWKDYVVEPSREVLLPDPLPAPYLQPKYTLVIEMKNVLIAPEWTYKTGHRFVKRPALDYFLDIVGYPNFEVVIYTCESSMSAPQVIESFDPKQRIMYKLYRDCTKYMNGHHVKDLSRLNRDLSKVIYIDYDPKSFQLNPENVLRVPKWEGDMNDTSLVDLAELLKTIHLSDVDDVRPTLQYYSQFDDPAKEFRRRAMYLAQQEQAMKEQLGEQEHSILKRYSGRLFGYRRHA
uniref:Mitochondrial import inner membrane translocase subunit TIM50 n=1 Tax=Ascaris suum TaxID=6253 RepID=F1KUG5_ASCSU